MEETNIQRCVPGRGWLETVLSKRPIAVAAAALLATSSASAFEFNTGTPDLKLRWDNTVKYSSAFRLKDASAMQTTIGENTINFDDGDRNFSKGLISNRVDLLSELDLTYQNVGARVSGAAWYDSVYNRATDNSSPFGATYNPISVPNTQFPNATRDLHGRKAELLDAFLFAKGEVGGMAGAVRAGRHALVFGETLFYGSNGIAAAQQPIDIVKAQSVPNTQFKELIRPVGQVSGQLQLNPDMSIGGYYQYRWQAHRLPAVGSYFSSADFLDQGGERLFTGVDPATGRLLAATRGRDYRAKDSGQGGFQFKWTPEGGAVDLGFYAARYNDKAPQVVLRPALGDYGLYYHEGIRTAGVSANTTVAGFNVGLEASVRHNTPLSNTATADLFGVVPAAFGGPLAAADNRDNVTYPVGKTAHLNISMLATLPASRVAQEAALVAEIAWNRVTSITRNASAIDPNAQRDGLSMRAVYTPTYRQVLSGLDVDVPIGIGYTPQGRSLALGPSFGPDNGGDISIGLNGVYESAWYFGLTYTHYYGGEATNATVTHAPQNQPQIAFNFRQTLKDRDFISLSVRRAF
ncbi:DUF1302 domain-containing protein [Janthinobacterium sp. HLX7-2]|uniref:DUF1302 domain-containing protein n=1 Tax=Janthinobacterium sp. HLX7-2 TaxID=1259331 RepID=UPI003F25A4E8